MIQNLTVPGDAMVPFPTCTTLATLVAGHPLAIGIYQALRKELAIGAPIAHRAPLFMNQIHLPTSAKARASLPPKARWVLQTKKKSGAKVASSSHLPMLNQKNDLEVCEVEATWHLLRTLAPKKAIGEVPLDLGPVGPVAYLVRFSIRQISPCSPQVLCQRAILHPQRLRWAVGSLSFFRDLATPRRPRAPSLPPKWGRPLPLPTRATGQIPSALQGM